VTARLRVSRPWNRTFSPVRALHHTGQPSGVVLSDASDEGRVPVKMLWRLHPLASLVIPHACSLVAFVLGRPCPNRARHREKWRERPRAGWRGRVGYAILGGASCRQLGRGVEARGTSKGYRSWGISSRARPLPGARSPQEGPGPPGVPGAPAQVVRRDRTAAPRLLALPWTVSSSDASSERWAWSRA
jgi:hypothetical protein